MSTIGVKYHNEDIHFIIRKPMQQTVKSPRYKSKWTVSKKQTEKKKYNGHQTFGLAHYEAPEFKNFLKKGKLRAINSPLKRVEKKESKSNENVKSSSLPRINSENKKGAPKNFVKENIKKAIALQPKVPVPRKVETPRGTAKDLVHLLQMIKIRDSEQYGKIPKYLCDRKKKWAKEKERQELEKEAIRRHKEQMGIGTMGMSENYYMINQETREKILDGLKENWNELSKQFLKLPVMTDTWPKIKRKMCLEREIEQLERDIKLVESHPFIYLERTDNGNLESLAAEQAAQRMMARRLKEEDKEEEKEPKESREPKEPKESREPKEPKEEVKVEEKAQPENTEPKPVSPVEETAEEKKEDDNEMNTSN